MATSAQENLIRQLSTKRSNIDAPFRAFLTINQDSQSDSRFGLFVSTPEGNNFIKIPKATEDGFSLKRAELPTIETIKKSNVYQYYLTENQVNNLLAELNDAQKQTLNSTQEKFLADQRKNSFLNKIGFKDPFKPVEHPRKGQNDVQIISGLLQTAGMTDINIGLDYKYTKLKDPMARLMYVVEHAEKQQQHIPPSSQIAFQTQSPELSAKRNALLNSIAQQESHPLFAKTEILASIQPHKNDRHLAQLKSTQLPPSNYGALAGGSVVDVNNHKQEQAKTTQKNVSTSVLAEKSTEKKSVELNSKIEPKNTVIKTANKQLDQQRVITSSNKQIYQTSATIKTMHPKLTTEKVHAKTPLMQIAEAGVKKSTDMMHTKNKPKSHHPIHHLGHYTIHKHRPHVDVSPYKLHHHPKKTLAQPLTKHSESHVDPLELLQIQPKVEPALIQPGFDMNLKIDLQKNTPNDLISNHSGFLLQPNASALNSLDDAKNRNTLSQT